MFSIIGDSILDDAGISPPEGSDQRAVILLYETSTHVYLYSDPADQTCYALKYYTLLHVVLFHP